MADRFHLTLGHTCPSAAYQLGRFTAILYKNGAALKSKTMNVASVGEDVAWETVDLWAKDRAKERGDCDYTPIPKFELLKRISEGSNRKHRATNKSKPAPNKSRDQAVMFTNLLWFNAAMDQAIINLGLKRVEDIIDQAKDILNTERSTIEEKERKKNEGFRIIASALWNAYKLSGVDMEHTIVDVNVKREYKAVKKEMASITAVQA